MVNSQFHLFQRKSLPTNDFKLTVPDLYITQPNLCQIKVHLHWAEVNTEETLLPDG